MFARPENVRCRASSAAAAALVVQVAQVDEDLVDRLARLDDLVDAAHLVRLGDLVVE